ncbi:cytochrome P450 [Rostrohypoxylon terebratum]|nr:cytochrome P450 [Rostrohypoxylon terebratum]
MAFSLLLIISAVSGIVFSLLGRLLNLPHDDREPALVPQNIPFIGHGINLLRNGTEYYSQIAKKCNRSIFTLNLPRAKMYVVTSPSLVAACDRCARSISFAPYVVAFAKRIMTAGETTVDLLSEDLFEDSPSGLRLETIRAMHEALKRDDLNDTMRTSLKGVLSFLDSTEVVVEGKGAPLFHWVRRFLSTVSTNSLYGEQNPMKDLKIQDDFWTTDQDFGLLGLDFLPRVIAPEASHAREMFFNAFRQYYAVGGLEGASRFIKARHEVNKKYGVKDEDIAHFDLGVCTALLVNTVPAMSWTLYYAFSNPTLLAQLRKGIEAVIFSSQSIHPDSTVSVNIPRIIKDVPLLESFVKEVLRVQSHGSSARYVLEDTFIDDTDGTKYLLKKNSIVTMPSALVHNSEVGWGPSAKVFKAARFLESSGNIKVHSSSYRSFGGGRAMCPGRHLATNLLMSTLLVMILRYDVDPVEGCWTEPVAKNHISTSFLMPVKDIWVKIQPRKLSAEWEFLWEPESSSS